MRKVRKHTPTPISLSPSGSPLLGGRSRGFSFGKRTPSVETLGGMSVLSYAQRPSRKPLVFGVIAVVILVALVAFGVSTCSKKNEQPAQDPAALAADQANARVSFVAAGDNLPGGATNAYADALSGATGDGAYDYAPIYESIKPYVEWADMALVNQESHLGGDDLGVHDYPSFNTPDAMADALVSTGFDLIATANNHAYDWGPYGAVEHSVELWSGKPVVFAGTAASPEQASELAVFERNGMRFALLNYTYGVNAYEPADLPAYAVSFIDEARIRADVTLAKQEADVVLVAMHWGTEYESTIDETQQRYADLLTELEVDMVIGAHPHVIGPLEWKQSASGHRTLVAYSLGNFLSSHTGTRAETQLEGLVSCEFVKTEAGVEIENVKWTPLVNHEEEGFACVYALKDYTNELAAKHPKLAGVTDAVGTFRTMTSDIIGPDFTIDM